MSKTPPNTRSRTTESGYHIGRPIGECAFTGETIEPGTEFIATLCETEFTSADGVQQTILERLDISEKAWEDNARPECLVFYWRTTMPDRESDQQAFVDDEVLVNLFDRLEGDDDPQRMAYRFVLGLILMRKRLLRCVSTEVRGDRTVWLMRRRGETAETPAIEMFDPDLDEQHERDLADQLGEVFRGEI
jgi:hypothetical protein